ncbi:MAG: hypothetical protein K2X27_04980 [Candidatus Obscuribacterales bacterium]|nr:hypothetical protein [Candidatus Obscuribacterales bacterium]
MGRTDRRQRTALDEAYRYFNQLESGEPADIYRLNKSVKTLAIALAVADVSEFKLTKQLWKRLHQALFDRLLTGFSGNISIFDSEHNELRPKQKLPEQGFLAFLPELCRRADDLNEIELSKLYPKTQKQIQKIWEERGSLIHPSDFNGAECDNGVCFMKPMVLGQEVLTEESAKGRSDAHHKWWDLYWQAYCSPSKKDQEILNKQMNDLEIIWGNLYY